MHYAWYITRQLSPRNTAFRRLASQCDTAACVVKLRVCTSGRSTVGRLSLINENDSMKGYHSVSGVTQRVLELVALTPRQSCRFEGTLACLRWKCRSELNL